MNSAAATYQKLPGRSVNFFGGRSQLWLGGDHLLEVTGMLLGERYRRFPLVDIRALVVEKTSAQKTALWIYGGIFGICVGLVGLGFLFWKPQEFSLSERAAVTIFLGVLAGIAGVIALVALLGLLITAWRGATCRCSVQTTAGLRVLATPRHRRAAAQLLRALQPQIEAAQPSAASPSS